MTGKPISTISYNSIEFLLNALNRLFDARVISEWYFIKHIGENGDKDHIHLYIMPNKRLDPMELSKHFIELDPSNVKPLGVLSWRPSHHLKDWLLYAVHNEAYLLSHNADSLDGKIRYSVDDIYSWNNDQLLRDFNEALLSACGSNALIYEALKRGDDLAYLCVIEGLNPITVNAMKRLYNERVRPLVKVDNDGVIYD